MILWRNERQLKKAHVNLVPVLSAFEYSKSAADKVLGRAFGRRLVNFLGKQELRGKRFGTANLRASLFGGC